MNRPALPILLLSVLICCTSAARAADYEQPLLRLGAAISLSGELSFFGHAFQQGVQLALAEGAKDTVSVFFEDDRSGDRTTTITALHSLMTRHQIQAAIVMAMPTAVVADPIARTNNLIVISAWDSNKRIEELSENTFGFGWSNERTGEDLARYAAEKLQLKTMAVVAAHDEWSELISGAFVEEFSAAGGRIVLRELVGLDDTDFRSLAARVRRSGADAVYFPLYRASLLSFAKQVTQSGYAGTLLSAEGITDNEVKQLGRSAEGMYITQARLDDAAFLGRYQQHFELAKVEANLAHVALGYDAVNYLSSCVRKLAREKKPIVAQNLRSVFQTLEFDGVLGPTRFSEGRFTDRGQAIYTVRGGKLVPVL